MAPSHSGSLGKLIFPWHWPVEIHSTHSLLSLHQRFVEQGEPDPSPVVGTHAPPSQAVRPQLPSVIPHGVIVSCSPSALHGMNALTSLPAHSAWPRTHLVHRPFMASHLPLPLRATAHSLVGVHSAPVSQPWPALPMTRSPVRRTSRCTRRRARDATSMARDLPEPPWQLKSKNPTLSSCGLRRSARQGLAWQGSRGVLG
jgi:hypothetical protein